MTIRWFGGKALALEVKARGTEAVRLFINPHHRTTRQRAGLPPSRAWIGSAAGEVPEGTFLIDGPGEYEVTPFAVKVIALGQPEDDRWAAVVASDECTVAYLDAESVFGLTPDSVEAIGDVVVLLVGFPDAQKAQEREKALKALGAVSIIEPKVFIPLASDTLLSFVLRELGAAKKNEEPLPSFSCRASSLPEEGMEVKVLSVVS